MAGCTLLPVDMCEQCGLPGEQFYGPGKSMCRSCYRKYRLSIPGRECSLGDCEAKHEAKGYCRTHYRKWLRTGDPDGVNYTPPECSVDGCGTRAHARGLCDKHYKRLRTHGSTDLPTRADRFWEKVDVGHPLGCWIWQGSRHPFGYGGFCSDDGRMSAHIWAWELLIGPVPAGLELDHLCREPSCVNPDHLEAVTHRENVMRGVVGFRSSNGTWGNVS